LERWERQKVEAVEPTLNKLIREGVPTDLTDRNDRRVIVIFDILVVQITIFF
jgi:hypothetical protein